MENNTDSHWMGNPTLSKLQEIIFDLYEIKKSEIKIINEKLQNI